MSRAASGGGALYIRTLGARHLERDGDARRGAGVEAKSDCPPGAPRLRRGEGRVCGTRPLPTSRPESDEARARSSLKQLIHAIRTELGADILLSTGALRLNPTRAWSDVAAFTAAVDEGRLAEAARVYTGPFLDGFHVRGAGPF